jgi:hypothetical protein
MYFFQKPKLLGLLLLIYFYQEPIKNGLFHLNYLKIDAFNKNYLSYFMNLLQSYLTFYFLLILKFLHYYSFPHSFLPTAFSLSNKPLSYSPYPF